MMTPTTIPDDLVHFDPFVGDNTALAEGEPAAERLVSGGSALDQLKVGRALMVGRRWAEDEAQRNPPGGRGNPVNKLFAQWLDDRPKLRAVNKKNRAAALWCLDPANVDAVMERLRRLTPDQQQNAGLRALRTEIETQRAHERGERVPDAIPDDEPARKPASKQEPEEIARLKEERAAAYKAGLAKGVAIAEEEAERLRAELEEARRSVEWANYNLGRAVGALESMGINFPMSDYVPALDEAHTVEPEPKTAEQKKSDDAPASFAEKLDALAKRAAAQKALAELIAKGKANPRPLDARVQASWEKSMKKHGLAK